MPSSKLSALCDNIIEAGWLAAVVATPLFFSVYSSRNTEPDKVSILRSIASVMAAAWIVRWFEERKSPDARGTFSWRAPLVVPTLVLVGVYLLATAASVAPQQAFLGASLRPQGAYLFLSCVVVCALLVNGLRTRRQLDRLLFAISAASLPVALYGLIQHAGLDPLAWSGDPSVRVGSTQSNPTFMAAYLIMAFFVTLGQLLDRSLFQRKANAPHDGWPKSASPGAIWITRARTAGYGLIAVTQLVAIVFSGSRGPWLGWFAGLVLFALMAAILLRRRRLALGAAGLGLAGLAFVLILNLSATPLASLRDTPLFYKLGRLFTSSTENRPLIWQGAAQLVLPHAPLQFPDGSPDALNALRLFVGYGPDTMPLVYNRFYSPRLDAPPFGSHLNVVIDRSHNETWDMLITTGLLGLLAFQFLLISALAHGLRWMGLLPTVRERNLFVGLWAGGGLAGSLAAAGWGGIHFLGLGLPIGTLLGLSLYMLIQAMRSGNAAALRIPDPSSYQENGASLLVLLASLSAGLLAHYVEVQVAFSIATTQLMFWVMLGALVAAGSGQLDTGAAEVEPVIQPKRHARPRVERAVIPVWAGSAAGYAAITAMILMTLVFGFVPDGTSAAGAARNVGNSVTLGLLLVTGLVSIGLSMAELTRASAFSTLRERLVGLSLLATLALMPVAAFGLGQAVQLAAIARTASATQAEDLVARANGWASMWDYYVMGLGAALALTALALWAEHRPWPLARLANRLSLVVLIPVVLAVAIGVNTFNLNPARADIVFKMGQEYDQRREWDAAIALYKRSLQLAPWEDFYYLSLGRAFLEKAAVTQPLMPGVTPQYVFNEQTQLKDVLNLEAQRTADLSVTDLLYAAGATLTYARDLNPLNTDHTANLARFYSRVADPFGSSSLTDKLLDQSSQYYAQAVSLSPNNVSLWNEWAQVDLDRQNPDAALQKLEHSLQLDAQFSQTWLTLGKARAARQDWSGSEQACQQALALEPTLVDAYVCLGDALKEQQDLARAAETYQAALEKMPNAAKLYSKLGYIYYAQGELAKAIAAYLKYTELTQDSNVWEAHRNLAVLYQETGDLDSAIRQIQISIRLAPEEVQAQLSELAARWQAQTTTP